jgi:hypothetical protein
MYSNDCDDKFKFILSSNLSSQSLLYIISLSFNYALTKLSNVAIFLLLIYNKGSCTFRTKCCGVNDIV